MAPVFVGYAREDQDVTLNHQHSEYRWMTFVEAVDSVAIPGNETALQFVEKHFGKRQPAEWLRFGDFIP